jgi:mannosyl-oligosaccharide alpha-1,3-glucosidase
LIPSTSTTAAVLTATLTTPSVAASPSYSLSIFFYSSGISRIRIFENDDRAPRWESPDVILSSGTKSAEQVRILNPNDALVSKIIGSFSRDTLQTFVSYMDHSNSSFILQVRHSPFQVNLYSTLNGLPVSTPLISVNVNNNLYYEFRRSKTQAQQPNQQVHQETAQGESAEGNSNRRILTWGEDGKPIYEDEHQQHVGESHEDHVSGGHADHRSETSANAGNNPAAEDAFWEETFQTHADSKPNGPMSVGVDVSFPFSTHVYGIPEHASTHALRATDGSEGNANEYNQPYRLYNLDVFEYELDNPMALYGSIPFMISHGHESSSNVAASAGVYWNNPTETYVDIKKNKNRGINTKWISESGLWDLSLIPGPTGKQVISGFTSLVGTQNLPPLFALGYHQCRWNYKDEADVYHVDSKFEEFDFPYDVLWLDIEHTDGKKYFTWDSNVFPNPKTMIDSLASRGHKMVTIIDPHMKRDSNYLLHKEAQEKGLYIRKPDGTSEYEGWCWPGSSSYLDFTSPATREFWADQFSLQKYAGSTVDLYTWNDMNEPSVFNGPEVTMHKDAKSIAGIEHREWHNLYGFYQQMASAEGQVKRSNGNSRHFVLSRAFFAGSQRFGAIWTGDNEASWSHLAQAAPMLLTIGVSGLTFSGADTGGFFKNPSTELMTRWYQAASFTPFFRAHAHIDTARREPWLFGNEVLMQLRSIVRTRYTFLAYWYTLFAEAHAYGTPTLRPLWLEYPTDPKVFAMEDQWMVGSDILVKPVIHEGSTSVSVYLPGNQPWYDIATGNVVNKHIGFVSNGFKDTITVPTPLSYFPVFQRGGSIIARQMRPRRSSQAMLADPYTLYVTLDEKMESSTGKLYLDDGSSYEYEKNNAFRLKSFQLKKKSTSSSSGNVYILSSSQILGGKTFTPSNLIEKVVLMGLSKSPKAVSIVSENAQQVSKPLSFEYDAVNDVVSIRKPDVKVAYDFEIEIIA